MVPYAVIIGEKYTYFLYNRYKIIENVKFEEGCLLNRTNTSLDPFDYHVEKCRVDSFKKLERSLIHTFWPSVEEDMEDEQDEIEEDEEGDNIYELEYTDGSNEVLKFFNQKCVICLEKDIEYIFKQCSHQCICEDCYQNKSNIDIIKCVV